MQPNRAKKVMNGAPFSYQYTMKKAFCSLLALLALLPALSACSAYDYFERVSEIKSDIFLAETEEFSLSLACVSREHPYLSDGVPCERSSLVEITLTDDGARERDYRVYVLDEKTWGGDMSYRSVRGDYFYSQGVEKFPETSVSLRVEWEEGAREICATSVRSETTLTPQQALDAAVQAERETVEALTKDGVFAGEFYVRLLRRKSNYYYIGIVDGAGNTTSLLLDAETGEVLARRAPN